jgi:hypothetical protein
LDVITGLDLTTSDCVWLVTNALHLFLFQILSFQTKYLTGPEPVMQQFVDNKKRAILLDRPSGGVMKIS